MKLKDKQIDFRELRKYEHLPLEIRAVGEDGIVNRIIQGYAVKYNMTSEVMSDYWGDDFVEEFAPGAFDETLRSQDQKCLWNHNTSYPLGSVRSNTLTIQSDSVGLYYEDDVPNNTWGNDALESIKRGDVDGSSFSFRSRDEKWSVIEIDGNEVYKRTILKADLYEVSPTTFPAYPDSEANVRSFRENGGATVDKRELTNDNESMKRKLALLKTYV